MAEIKELMERIGALTEKRRDIDAVLLEMRAELEKQLVSLGLRGEVNHGGIKAGISYPKPSVKITNRAGLTEYVAAVWPSEIAIREVPAERVTEIRGAFLADLVDRMAAGKQIEPDVADELAEYMKVEQGDPYLRVTLLATQSAEGE